MLKITLMSKALFMWILFYYIIGWSSGFNRIFGSVRVRVTMTKRYWRRVITVSLWSKLARRQGDRLPEEPVGSKESGLFVAYRLNSIINYRKKEKKVTNSYPNNNLLEQILLDFEKFREMKMVYFFCKIKCLSQ